VIYTTEDHYSLLTSLSEPVVYGDPQIETIIAELLSDVDKIGVGLAAPQIGYLKSIVVMQLDGPQSPYTVALNPRFMGKNNRKHLSTERCLSVPDKLYQVMRYDEVIASWMTPTFKPKTRHLKGFAATVLQHEVGHLRGLLISDVGYEVTLSA
jgi:peptide deformylase